MTNRLAIILAVLIVAAILADVVFNGGAAMLFLLKKFIELLEYLAFWR
ncbi:MAG: hypothetical protein AAFO93_06460 [Pseudomonadota bacterium]